MRRLKEYVCLIFVLSCVIAGVYGIRAQFVKDHTAPVITISEDTITVSVNDEKSKLLEGVTAKDKRDGDLTESIRVSSMSHFVRPSKKRTIQYVVFDKAGNVATAEREVEYSDYTSPKIHLMKPLRCTDHNLASFSLSGNMTAEDCLDGNLTEQMRIVFDEEYYENVVGVYQVKAQVSNSAGDVRVVPLELTVTDSTNREENNKSYPMLSEYIAYTNVNVPIDLGAYLIGIVRNDAEYTFAQDGEYLGFGPESIGIQANVDYSVPGNYTAEYIFTNELGISAVTKLVIVVEE